MLTEQMWSVFCKENGIDTDTPYEAWQFGDDPDKLAQLVMEGKKTGTASSYDLYVLDPLEKLPEAGDYSIVLNGSNEPVCIIQTVKTYICRFMEVSEDHAKKEGEGDFSLSYWRKVHESFFKNEYKTYGLTFDVNTARVLCEEFQVVYKKLP